MVGRNFFYSLPMEEKLLFLVEERTYKSEKLPYTYKNILATRDEKTLPYSQNHNIDKVKHNIQRDPVTHKGKEQNPYDLITLRERYRRNPRVSETL